MSESSATLASSLLESASAVAALGDCAAELASLDDASVVAGMGLVTEHRRALQAYELVLAAEIARRSDHTLGYDGLARRSGSATPAVFIQSVTGSSIEDATKLARLGQSMVDAVALGREQTPVATAAVSGGISVDAADAIRRGLGRPDAAVTAEQLDVAAQELIARAGGMTPEGLLKAARRSRNELDLAAIERGEKQRAAARYVRTWSRDGLSGGSWCLPDEDGGLEIHTALKLLLAKTNGGPRFADATASKNEIEAVEDDRTPEQALADGFAQIVHNGIAADPSIVPGAARAAVRVIVAEKVLVDQSGSALLEESMSAISFSKLGEYLCEGGMVGILLKDDGAIDVGREQRLFTTRQRTALGVRDGGCRFPGCNKPPSFCEAHHIKQWARDHGRTDIKDGILLCRYHHMFVHNQGWEIIRDVGTYWLKPPKSRDPNQRLIEVPTRNPLVAAMKHAQPA